MVCCTCPGCCVVSCGYDYAPGCHRQDGGSVVQLEGMAVVIGVYGALIDGLGGDKCLYEYMLMVAYVC